MSKNKLDTIIAVRQQHITDGLITYPEFLSIIRQQIEFEITRIEHNEVIKYSRNLLISFEHGEISLQEYCQELNNITAKHLSNNS